MRGIVTRGDREGPPPGTAHLLVVVWRNRQFLTRLNFIGIVQLIAIRVKDPHVFVRISVELFTDLGKVVSRFNGVSLSARAGAAASRRAHRSTAIDADVRSDVIRVWTDEFDLIPELVFGFFGGRNAADEELVVLNM